MLKLTIPKTNPVEMVAVAAEAIRKRYPEDLEPYPSSDGQRYVKRYVVRMRHFAWDGETLELVFEGGKI